MIFKPTLAVVGLAAFSSALLLPPNIAPEDSDIVSTLPFDIAIQADSKVIHLACPGCPVPISETNDGFTLMTTTLDSELRFDFNVHHFKHSDVLTLNGIQLFPVDHSKRSHLRAPQTITTPKIDSESPSDVVQADLGYESRISVVNAPTEAEHLALFIIHIQVVEVGGRWVDNLEAIDMKLIATPAGGILIADVAKSSTTNPTLLPGADCTTMICKVKQTIGGKISQIKPAMERLTKGKGCGGKGKFGMAMPINRHGKGGEKYGQDGFRYGGTDPHRHGRHQRLHRFLHTLKSIAIHVLIPVSIGIACGMAASLIGMVVGHAIVFLWRSFYRRGQAQAFNRVEQSDPKSNEDFEAPPSYTDEEATVVDAKSAEL